MNRWYPHVTVATVIPQNGKFLFVKEHTEQGIAYNQPAGHLEEGEDFIRAAQRETLEETGWQINITGFLGVSRYVAPSNKETYIRFSFVGEAIRALNHATLDDGIICAQWLSKDELIAATRQYVSNETPSPALRSPLVLRDIEQFERGEIFPLSLLHHT